MSENKNEKFRPIEIGLASSMKISITYIPFCLSINGIHINSVDEKTFLETNTFKDKDGRITIKQLTLAMEEIFGISDDSEENTDAAHDFQSLLWSVKIDMESFLEVIEKCRLRQLLRQANNGVEESMNKLFEMMDKVCK